MIQLQLWGWIVARKKCIEDCNGDGREVLKYASTIDECEVSFGGKHGKVKVKGRGSVTVPNRKMGKGLWCAVKRQWYALGLLAIILYFQIVQEVPIIEFVISSVIAAFEKN